MSCPFQGSFVALPTPFRGERLALDDLEELVELHAARDTAGIVVAGTTGEASTLNDFERRSLIHAAVDASRGRLQVIAGVGTNCTHKSIELARFAAGCGVDGLLAVTPYYNKPTRKGLLLHFGLLADATDVPLVLYNVPGRTGLDMAPEVTAELAVRHETVVAIKETVADVERVRALVASGAIDVLCGEDALLFEYLEAGAVGNIGVTSNLLPDAVAELCRVGRADGDPERARELAASLAPVTRALFLETNPGPVKAALELLGRCSAALRPPLAPLEDETRARLEQALRRAGLLAMQASGV